MGYFNRGNNKQFGGRSKPREMHQATCSKCGKQCEVPFKPTGEKPVYCSNCFAKNGKDSHFRKFKDQGFRKVNIDSTQYKEQFTALNAKLDKILSLLDKQAPVVKKKRTSEKDLSS